MRIMLRYSLLTVLFCACFSLSVIGQEAEESTESLLWEISKDGMKAPSYLFGTFHLLNNGFLETWPAVSRAFSTCDALIVETVIDSSELGMVMNASLMEDTLLTDLFDSSQYNLISDVFEETTGMSLSLFNDRKPIFVGVLLTLFENQQLLSNMDPYEGVPMDVYFAEEAKAAKRPVFSLESMKEQARLLYSQTSVSVQATELLVLINDYDEANDLSEQLLNAYQSNDLNGLEELNEQDYDHWGNLDHLLEDRNEKWLIRIPEILEQQPTFIAAGALHLVGPTGLISGLRAAGYTVRPIPVK